MTNNSQQYNVLFKKLIEGKLSPKEMEDLIEWLGDDQMNPETEAMILAELEQSIQPDQINTSIRTALDAKLPSILCNSTQHEIKQQRIISLKSTWLRYAAAIILLIVISIWGLNLQCIYVFFTANN